MVIDCLRTVFSMLWFVVTGYCTHLPLYLHTAFRPVCLSVCQSDPLNCLPFYQKLVPNASSPDASFPLLVPPQSCPCPVQTRSLGGAAIACQRRTKLHRFALILIHSYRDQLEWFRRIPPSVQHRSLCRSSILISCMITGGRSIGPLSLLFSLKIRGKNAPGPA